MFRDTQEALKRLEAQLLAEEAEEASEEETPAEEELTDGDMEELRRLLKEPQAEYRNYANNYRAYNTDSTDTDPEEYSRALQAGGSRGSGVLVFLLVLLLVGVIVLLAWWLARWGGLV